MATGCTPACTDVYRRRRPECTVLYRTVQTPLTTWLELPCDRRQGAGGPAHVEREFHRSLECGILAHGFARARCAQCGHDFLIAWSCKGRGVCPAGNPRRMVETAAHLADPVFPRLPVCQWVLSVPKRLRYHLQHDPTIETLALRISRDWRLASTPKSGAAGCCGRSSSRGNASHPCRRNSSWPGWSPTTREYSTPWRVQRSRSGWRDCCTRRRLGRPGWLRAGCGPGCVAGGRRRLVAGGGR